MASVRSALDAVSGMNYGENGHIQYAWGLKVEKQMDDDKWQEDFVRLSFQLVRGDGSEAGEAKIGMALRNLIAAAQRDVEGGCQKLALLMKLTMYTRDPIAGKGEWALFYTMMNVWMSFPSYEKALVASFPYLFTEVEKGRLPIGSWKDVKYLYRTNNGEPEVMEKLIAYAADTLIMDLQSSRPSLLGRWAPREKASNGSFARCARMLARIYMERSGWVGKDQHSPATFRYVMAQYRKVVSLLNARLKTPQIKMSSPEGDWSSIDFDKDVTSVTMRKQRKAFLARNRSEYRTERQRVDRQECAENYLKYVADCRGGEKKMKGKRVGLDALVRDAIACGESADGQVRESVCLQWEAQGADCPELENCIAMVDTSSSMTWANCPYYAALGLGIRIAEKSTLGKRLIQFAARPRWINLDSATDFVEMVETVHHSEAGYSTDLIAALRLVASACRANSVTPDDVANLTLIICSDMQVNEACSCASVDSPMDERVVRIFEEAGRDSAHGQPYPTPHVVWWNMRQTEGFPSSTAHPNMTMLSGYSDKILESLAKKGRMGLTDTTPWAFLRDALTHERYSWVDDLFE